MPKYVKDPELRELQRDPRTGIYFVRKRVKGKPALLRSTGVRDRTKARKIALELLANYMAHIPPTAAQCPTFREIGAKVLALKANKAHATRELAESRLRLHLGPYFNHMEISKITENTWDAYIVAEHAKGPRKLADDAKIMMSVMKYAFNEGLLKRKVRIRNPDPPTDEGRAYTADEVKRLMDAASTADMRLQILIGVTMGMRHGEIAHLRWDWIDFEKGEIKLPATETKTRRGRAVPMNEDVRKSLADRHGETNSPCVFPSRANPNQPIPDFDSQWQRTWARAGIKGRFHWTRHTAISNMAAAGIPESTIKKITGCSQRTMNRVYIHLKSDVAAKAVNLGAE